MPSESSPEFGINSWFEDDLYQLYLHDPAAVDPTWRRIFEGQPIPPADVEPAPSPAAPAAVGQALPPANLKWGGPPGLPSSAPPPPLTGDTLQPLRGAAGRIAEN